MPTLLQHAWTQAAAVGLLIVLLVVGIVKIARHYKYMEKMHRNERAEWRNESQAQTDKMISVVESNSSVMSEICTLIKARRE